MSNDINNELTEAEILLAKEMNVWVVWYEDRFGWGSDRDPASPMETFLSEIEAQVYKEANGGDFDIPNGKFDGCFIQEWNLLKATERKVTSLERAKILISIRRNLNKNNR